MASDSTANATAERSDAEAMRTHRAGQPTRTLLPYASAADSERPRQSVERLLTEPVQPVDPRWLADFLLPRR